MHIMCIYIYLYITCNIYIYTHVRAWYINAPESIHLFCPSLPQAPGLSSNHDDGGCEDVVPWIGRYLRDEMIRERGIRIADR